MRRNQLRRHDFFDCTAKTVNTTEFLLKGEEIQIEKVVGNCGLKLFEVRAVVSEYGNINVDDVGVADVKGLQGAAR